MTSEEIRQKFLEFFEKKKHKTVSSSSLIPTDPSVLLTTAGMQQFKPYYLGEKSPYGENAASAQKCFRTSDIDEVGDESHLTFFEMLGNFSFGGYFKEKAIQYAYDFIAEELSLKIDYVSVFAGDSQTPADTDSQRIWTELKEKNSEDFEIKKFGREDNFWGPTGEEGPCGPTTEIYVNGVEIWNLVFNEYFKNKEGEYANLENPGVDTGMGLERLSMMMQGKTNVFETDLFLLIIDKINKLAKKDEIRAKRIIADHVKGACFIIMDGEHPSNLGRGYILRRLIRRAVMQGKNLGIDNGFLNEIAEEVLKIYKKREWYVENKENIIFSELSNEEFKFGETLEKGLRQFEKISHKEISGKDAFILFSTYGFPLEMTQELAKQKGLSVDDNGFKQEMKKHQNLSRTTSQGMFKSGLAGESEQEVKYHTATHLLLAALRQVLGQHVTQRGSNITSERLRLDFSHPKKLSEEEKQKIENLVNQKIEEDISIICEEVTLEEAEKSGALGEFGHKYEEKVKVYSINNFSREICGGPHAEKTGMLGKFKIKKEEASSAGVRRIKAVLI